MRKARRNKEGTRRGAAHGCETFRVSIGAYLENRLPQEKIGKLEAHLRTCELCQEEFARLSEDWIFARKGHLEFAGRPVWGEVICNQEKVEAYGKKLADRAEDADGDGQLVGLVHDALQSRSIPVILLNAAARLRQAGKQVRIFLPQWSDDWASVLSVLTGGRRVSVIHHATSLPDFGITASRELGSVIFAATHGKWERMDFLHGLEPVVSVHLSEDEAAELEREAEEEASRERAEVEQKGLLNVFLRAALWDAMGVPVPLSFLAFDLWRSEESFRGYDLQKAEEEIRRLLDDRARGHLFWVRDEYGKPLSPPLVCTEGEVIARKIVGKAFGEDDLVAQYSGIVVRAQESGRPEHARAILKLLHNMSLREPKEQVRRILEASGESIGMLYRDAPPPAVLGWGRLHARVGLVEDAERILREGYDRADEQSRVYLGTALVKVLKDQGKLPEAKRVLEAIGQPENLYVRHLRADVLRAQRDFPAARAEYEAILRDHPRHVPTKVSQAAMFEEQGELAAAEPVLREARDDEPWNAYVRAKLAHVVARQPERDENRTRFAEADEICENLQAENPRSVVGLHVRADLALKRGHFAKAEVWLKKGLKIASDSAYCLLTMAELHLEREEWDEARKILEGLVASERWNLEALVTLATLCIKTGDFPAAGLFLSKAEDTHDAKGIRERSGKPWRNSYIETAKARQLMRQGNLREAEDAFERAHSADRRNVAILCTWATELLRFYESADSREQGAVQARAVLDRLERSPENVFDKIRLENTWAEVELAAGKADEALKHVNVAHRWDDKNSYTLKLLSQIYQALGQHARAEDLAREADVLRREPPS